MTNTTEDIDRILIGGCSKSLNFPLWVLIQDGLQVAPFNKHRSRYGILQKRSMDAASWYEWFRLLVIRCDNRIVNKEYVPEYKGLDMNHIRNCTPPQLWNGDIRVKEILDIMWDDFKSTVEQNKYVDELLSSPERWDKDLHGKGFRQVFICDYPYEIEVFIPPIFHIVTVREKPIDVEIIRQRISRSLEQ